MRNVYEKRIIAFIDILGFENKIKETAGSKPEAKKKLEDLCDSLLLIEAYIREAQVNLDLPPNSSNLTLFSDSIVISLMVEDSYKALEIFALFKRIQINLLRANILLRGGIVVGEIIHDNLTILGPGLIKAFKLESKCAQYPRIVIDPEVLQQTVKDGGKVTPFKLKSYDYHETFNYDFDGTAYIDYFNDIENYLNAMDVLEYYEKLCQIVDENLTTEEIDIRMKYLWMLEKLKSANVIGLHSELFEKYLKKHVE